MRLDDKKRKIQAIYRKKIKQNKKCEETDKRSEIFVIIVVAILIILNVFMQI